MQICVLGSAIQAINKGEVSIGLAANAIRGNELYQLFEHMNAQDLIETIAAYSNIDAPNLKIIQFDIDYIIRPEHQSIIEQVLLTAKQGHEPMVVEQYTYEMKKSIMPGFLVKGVKIDSDWVSRCKRFMGASGCNLMALSNSSIVI